MLCFALLLASGCEGPASSTHTVKAEADPATPSRPPPPDAAKADEPETLAVPSARAEEPDEPTPSATPKTFAEETVALHKNATPTSGASTLAWKHYKAKKYEQAQREFVLASLFEPTQWKHPFNLACASAMAADEDLARIALAEAVARDPVRTAAKARKDPDLQGFRERDWFEPTLRGDRARVRAPGSDHTSPEDESGAQDGAVYIVLDAGPKGYGGLARLSRSGRWSLVHDSATRMVHDPKGRLYIVSGNNDISRIEPLQGGESVIVPSSLSWVNGVAAAGEGTFWAIGMRGMAFYDGTSWSATESEATLGRGRLYPTNITVLADGGVWVTNDLELYRVDGEVLHKTELPGPDDRRIDEFHIGGDGTVFLRRYGDVLRLTDGAWERVDLAVPDIGRLDTPTLTTRLDGTMALFKRSGGTLAFQRPDRSVSQVPLEYATRAGTVAADSAGRFWVATDAGLFVVRSDLSGVARWYPRGSVDTLQPGSFGWEYGLRSIWAQGAAVALPAAAKPKGWVRGVFTKDGSPLAGAGVELCEDPLRGRLGSMGTPCEGPEVGKVARFGQTGDDGSFLFFDVPRDRLLELSVHVGDHWFVTRDWPCCDTMPASGIHDLGTIAYKAGKKYRTR